VWSPKLTKKKQKRKRYTDEFKAEVLRAVETRGQRTIGEVAASLGVSEGLIHSWKGKVSEEDAARSDRGETLDQEVRRLRRELADVKKDRDVLVKSIAVFVKERK
jgi:transposase